uniref:Uncharacterized protein n=1 Tax=Octopus bimaculoides TaxID=37653 RepID=A0A0L8GXN7_OCTBM
MVIMIQLSVYKSLDIRHRCFSLSLSLLHHYHHCHHHHHHTHFTSAFFETIILSKRQWFLSNLLLNCIKQPNTVHFLLFDNQVAVFSIWLFSPPKNIYHFFFFLDSCINCFHL